MKLSRPVLATIAAATAVAAAAGSTAFISTTRSAPEQVASPLQVDPLDDGTTNPPADPDSPAHPAPAGEDVPAEQPPAPATGDAGSDNEPPANPGEAETVDGFVESAGNSPVPPEIEAAADTVPDTAPQPAAKAEMRQLEVAPKLVTGKGEEDQAWFAKTKQGNVEAWQVYSESMQRFIPVAIVPAKDRDGKKIEGAPTLYMLNGAGGAEQDADWINAANADEVFKNKGVNLVIPMEGAFSYYVDWLEDGEVLREKSHYFKGAQKWTTFLGRELRPAVEDYLKANDKRGVVGMSMSATSSLLLAQHYPGEYQAVGSYSGCAATSTPFPWAFSALTINRAAKDPTYRSLTPAHAWGPMGSPYNRYNDALVNADKLKGSALYISNASGLAAETDMYGYRVANGQSPQAALAGSATTVVEGGVIEAATNSCTHDLRAKLNSKGIDAHYEFRNAGTHTWAVWRDDLRQSWNKVLGEPLVGPDFSLIDGVKDPTSWNPSSN